MLAGISTFLFGVSGNDESNEFTEITETDIRENDGDEWVLVDIEFERRMSKERNETTTKCVPQEEKRNSVPETTTKNTPTATQTNAPQSNSNGTMEGSWFVTPPPCFTHPNTFTMESSPLEDILIEHPSISVFSPRPPPVEMKASVAPVAMKKQSSRHSGASTCQTRVTKTRKPQQERENLHQRAAVCDPSTKAGLFAEITNVLAPMQKATEHGSQKYLKKSFMNRQNKVAHRLNSRPSRREKLSTTINGYSINRKMC